MGGQPTIDRRQTDLFAAVNLIPRIGKASLLDNLWTTSRKKRQALPAMARLSDTGWMALKSLMACSESRETEKWAIRTDSPGFFARCP